MNIREIIKEVKYIYYFSGGVAFFRAEDKKGRYQGLIDRKGEVLWSGWRTPALRLTTHPDYIKTANEKKEWIWMDVRSLQFVEEPECIKAEKSSRAWQMVNNASANQFIKGVETLFDLPTKKYLNEEYIAFSEKEKGRSTAEKSRVAAFMRQKWGVQDLEGRVVLPAIFEDVDKGGKENHFVVKYAGLCGVTDDKMQWVVPREYADIICYGGNDKGNGASGNYVAYIQKDEKECVGGMLDKEGQVLLPFEYEDIFPSPTEELITVRQAGQWKVVNLKNETVFEIGK